jgi:hypothetical protein
MEWRVLQTIHQKPLNIIRRCKLSLALLHAWSVFMEAARTLKVFLHHSFSYFCHKGIFEKQ